MFKLSAGTQIQVFAPFGEAGAILSAHTQGDISYVDTAPWKPYTTKEDKLYDKEQVWDAVALHNPHRNIPTWARFNIEKGYSILKEVKNSKVFFALVNPLDLQYLN